MIKKIPRKFFLERYPGFPVANDYNDKYFFPETYSSYILCVDAKSAIGLCKNISAELSALIKQLGFGQMIFLGDTTSPWLFREHDYKPVIEALGYLRQHKISKSFNGAISVDEADLPAFLKQIFWLVRCNGVVFTPYFANYNFDVIINICQYGNVHFSTINKAIDDAFNEVLTNTRLTFFEGERCVSYKIAHRVASR